MNNDLASINFSNCVALTEIDRYAFSNNELASLDLSDCTSLTYIGEYAFSNNTGLSSFNLPAPDYSNFIAWVDEQGIEYAAGVSVSDFSTFYRTKLIYTLTDDDIEVTDGIIQSCSYDFTFTDIIIPDMLDGQIITGIKDASYASQGVFFSKGITSISFPAALKTIGNHSFYNNELIILDLSACNELTEIGYYAFYNNELDSINFSTCTKLTKIDERAFYGNELDSIDLSDCTSLIYIGEYAFYNNPGLSSFTLPTPGYLTFQAWVDDQGVEYAAGVSVSDFSTFYKAIVFYTLTDGDVEVTDGIIQSCSYDFAITDIIIPEILDGQTITGIKDVSYADEGVFL
jgi:hypothetical protein